MSRADSPWSSVPGVCDVTLHRGVQAGERVDVLLEVPHGATRAAHFDALRRELCGSFPEDLRDFFFVNTDVGAPELAEDVARRIVAADPSSCVAVVRCQIPRTFIDCNRVIAADAQPASSAAGQMTPGVHAWVREAADLKLLLARYQAYRELVTRAFERVCGAGGLALMVHSYAPRSIDVPVDERIVEHLRAAYAPDKIHGWPLRAPIDLIVDTPEGERLASERLFTQARAEFGSAGFEVASNAAYALHPSTLAHEFARRHPGRTLCLEVRRDLLVREFTPFAEMHADAAGVGRVAEPLARAVLASRS